MTSLVRLYSSPSSRILPLPFLPRFFPFGLLRASLRNDQTKNKFKYCHLFKVTRLRMTRCCPPSTPRSFSHSPDKNESWPRQVILPITSGSLFNVLLSEEKNEKAIFLPVSKAQFFKHRTWNSLGIHRPRTTRFLNSSFRLVLSFKTVPGRKRHALLESVFIIWAITRISRISRSTTIRKSVNNRLCNF